MARRKEVSKEKILEVSYQMAMEKGVESLTARKVADAVNCSTQPIYLEFNNMDDLRDQVLQRIEIELKTKIFEEKFINEPFIDLCLAYINFAIKYPESFRAMYVENKFGNSMVKEFSLELGMKKLEESYPNNEFSESKKIDIIKGTWIMATGLGALTSSGLMNISQYQMVDLLTAQINDLIINNRLATPGQDAEVFAQEFAQNNLKMIN